MNAKNTAKYNILVMIILIVTACSNEEKNVPNRPDMTKSRLYSDLTDESSRESRYRASTFLKSKVFPNSTEKIDLEAPSTIQKQMDWLNENYSEALLKEYEQFVMTWAPYFAPEIDGN